MKVYVVTITRWDDDYKHRYGSHGSEVDFTGIFSTFHKARRKVLRIMKHIINNHIGDYPELLEDNEEAKKYLIRDDDGDFVLDPETYDYDDLQKLLDIFLKGEYVEHKYTYDIEKMEMDEYEV